MALDEKDVFLAALALPDGEGREAYLQAACAGHPALLGHVRGLLSAYQGPQGPLDRGPAVLGITADAAPPEGPSSVLGPYKLVEPIGEGGMGTVWMAQQQEPVKRLVAVKLIKSGMDNRQVVARFEAERQALALMDHPHIARVLDGGTTESGRPFFVMDLVKGVPITKYCDEHRLTPRQRLELFLPVCQAVQHAHQKGVIHRDLKPSNVLVALYDGKPVPKVIDFGVAKAAGQQLTEKTLVTGFGNIVGTLEYMSPEQAESNQLDVDTRSDIYSLGVLLYELLAGSPPFTRKDLTQGGVLDMLRVIREQEPTRPSTKLSTAEGLPTLAANRATEPAKLARLVRGELDWIVMKALEKDRNRRYETANGFAADVQHYLADEPVLACPPSVGYRLRKFARRNKAALAMVSLVFFFIVLLGGVVGWAMRDRGAREQEIALDRAKKLALTEEGVRQALDRGTRSRAELHDILKRPGGVQELLNQPARWELFLKTAQGELAQARRLALRAEGDLDADLTLAMDRLDQQLTNDQADYDLALSLERFRQDQAILGNNQLFDNRNAIVEYQKRFARFGVLGDDPAAAAARLAFSPIREQLVAALDQWAVAAFNVRDYGLAERLLTMARQAAADPAWGDRVRQVSVWDDREALEKLAAQAPIAGSSPPLLLIVGLRLSFFRSPLAIPCLRRAQAEHPTDFWLNFELALALQPTNPAEAVGFYRAALAIRPGTAAVYNNLGVAFSDQKKLDEAIPCYHKAIELDPTYASPHCNLGSVLLDLKQFDEAIDAYRKAIELDPRYSVAHCNLGNALLDLKQFDQAINAYHKAIEINPKYAKAYCNLGVALTEQGKLVEAVDAYRKAIEIDPNNAIAHGNLGHFLREQGKPADAEAACRRAIELDPNFANAYNILGLSLSDQGKRDDAIAAFRKAVELDPKLTRAHSNLGSDLGRRGNFEEAATHFLKAIELDPKHAAAYIGMGACASRQNKPGEAIAWYRKALAIKADDLKAHENLAVLLATCPDPKFRNSQQAVEHAKKAVELDPRSTAALQALGWAQYRAGGWRESIDALEKSCKLQSGTGDAGQWIVIALAHAKLAGQEGLTDKEREHHKMEARRRYEEATKQIDQLWRVRPGEDAGRAIWDFREEARKLMGLTESKK
jgi:tetratricopeptide (TPR) repeat protein/serine/threonine protein kinase